MVLDYFDFLNESTKRDAKRELKGSLNMVNRKKMRELLKHNIVTFKFRKKNGDLRKARGTLISSYLPKLKGGAPKPEHQMVYFDLEKDGWRSFRSFTFIKILDIKGPGISSTSVSSSTSASSSKHMSKHEDDEEETKKMRDEEIKETEKDEREESVEKPEKHTTHKEEPKEKPERHKKDEEEHDEEHESKSDEHKEKKEKEYKVGDKIPEDELVRRSADFRHGSRKNKTTKKANDEFRKEHHKKEKDED